MIATTITSGAYIGIATAVLFLVAVAVMACVGRREANRG